MITLHFILLICIVLGLATNCGKPAGPVLEAGDVYSVTTGDGDFAVVKILVYEDGIAHIRLYKNKFVERPTNIDVTTLSLGSIGDAEGFGIGHLAIQESELRS